MRKLSARLSTRYFAVLIIVLVLLIVWRLSQIIFAPNVLINPNFSEDLSGWNVAGQGNAQVTEGSLRLEILDSPQGNWQGAGQKISIDPNRRYSVTISYRLIGDDHSSGQVLLRMLQLDREGNQLDAQEVSNPTPLKPSTEWQVLPHTFTAAENATTVEIAVGLVGQQATRVDVNEVALKPFPSPMVVTGLNVLTALVGLLLVSGLLLKLFTQWRISAGLPSPEFSWKPLVIVLVNLVLLFIFAELAALAIYAVRDGELFYARHRQQYLIQDEEAGDLTRYRIHPYFGYTLRPHWTRQLADDYVDVTATTNNQGFLSEKDYPVTRTGDHQYFVGIFGGSVAEELYLLGRDSLVEAMQQNEFFAGKDIVVLNFAKAGYKQPQQAILLTYWLTTGQALDMAINLDGFNEVALNKKNSNQAIDINMPHSAVMKPLINLTNRTTLTSEKLQSFATIDRTKKQLNSLAERLNNTQLASVSFLLEQYYNYLNGQYTTEVAKIEAMESNPAAASLLFIQSNENNPPTDAELYKTIADNWVAASVTMDQMMRSRNGHYIHILQPDQYYSNKTFSENELRDAINPSHQYKPAAEQGYPYLEEKIPELTEKVPGFASALHLFDDTTDTIYRDDCCHYTQLGYDMMAQFIADTISRLISGKDRQSVNRSTLAD